MKISNTVKDLLMVGLISLTFSAASAGITSYYYQHLAVVHHAACYEADSWGNVSFHWNDVSFAQTPFQDPDPVAKLMEDAYQNKLKSLGIK